MPPPRPRGDAAPVLWTFADLPQAVKSWYDSDSVLNTLVSGQLSTIFDQSGNGRHATPDGGFDNNRATYVAALNGVPAWRGLAAGAGRGAFTVPGAAGVFNNVGCASAFILQRVNTQGVAAGAEFSTLFFSGGASNSSSRFAIAQNRPATGKFSMGNRRIDGEAFGTIGLPADIGLDWNIVGGQANWAASVGYVDINGVLTPGAVSGPGNTSATDSLAIGIGSFGQGSAAGSFDSDTRVVLYLAGALTVADRQRIEGRMAWGYGGPTIVAKLAANHPYKSAPPYKP